MRFPGCLLLLLALSCSSCSPDSTSCTKRAIACEACMTVPPVVAQYTGTGTTENHGDLDIYVTGSGTKGVVFIPDIFGVTPQAVQVADKLAGAGFLVGFPDPFRGKPWPMDKFPPPNRDELMDWIHGFSYDGHVKLDIDATVAALRAKGATSFGIVGFCWGGKMSTLAAQGAPFSASATAHPSFLTDEDAQRVAVPLLLLPSKDEADLSSFVSIVSGKGIPVSKKVFGDMHHGWCGARGDYSDAHQAERAREAIQDMANFFAQYVK